MKQKIAFAGIMGLITTGLISFTLIAINIGFSSSFLVIWLRSWSTAYVVVIPVILLVGPQVQHLVNGLFKDKKEMELD